MALTQDQKDKMAAGRKAAAEKKKLQPKEATPEKVASPGLVSMEVVEKLLEKQRLEFEAKLEKVETKTYIASNNIGLKEQQPIGRNEIPAEDQLETPVWYYAYGAGITLRAYTVRGSEVKSPYERPVKLTRFHSDIAYDSEGNRKEQAKCATAIWSKKEVKYIENSPQFKGGFILKSLNDMKPEFIATQNQRSQALVMVSAMTKNELIDNCRKRQIKVDEDFSSMETKLIESYFNEFTGKISEVQKKAAERTAEDIKKYSPSLA